MNIKMTIREALEIQAKQIKHYSKYRSDLADVLAKKTNVEGCDIDTPMSIFEINKRVPRGGDIEYLCGLSDVQREEKKKQREEALSVREFFGL